MFCLLFFFFCLSRIIFSKLTHTLSKPAAYIFSYTLAAGYFDGLNHSMNLVQVSQKIKRKKKKKASKHASSITNANYMS